MTNILVPIFIYFIPCVLLFYVAALIHLRNRNSSEHRLAAAITVCFHLWFLGEFMIAVSPLTYAIPIKMLLVTPVILLSIGLSCPLFLMMSGYNKIKKVTSIVFVALTALYAFMLNSEIYADVYVDQAWKYFEPAPSYIAVVVLLNLYATALIVLMWMRGRKESAGPSKNGLIILTGGLIASYLFITLVSVFQEPLRQLWKYAPFFAPYGAWIIVVSFLYVLHKYTLLPSHHYMYKTWFHLSSVGSLILDDSGKIAECNPAFEKISGYRSNELQGQSFFSLFEVKLSEIGDFRNPLHARQVVLHCADKTPQTVLLDSEFVTIGRQKRHFVMIHDMTVHQQEVQRMKHLAYHDNLTGLANRRLFLESFSSMKEEADVGDLQLACMVVDLDDFKKVNDTMGHNAGDKLLKVIAERLTACVRHHDLVVRLGGDEFVILVLAPDFNIVTKVTQRIMEKLVQPIHISERSWTISPSIGISLYPEHGKQSDTLLEKADRAMYAAKHNGKNNFVIYSPRLDSGLGFTDKKVSG